MISRTHTGESAIHREKVSRVIKRAQVKAMKDQEEY
jgi:ribosomal protein S18